MSLITLMRALFNRDVTVNVTYEFKKLPLEMPGDGECVILQFPPGTPDEIMKDFDARIVEFQNQERKFVTTNAEVKFIKCKKSALEVEQHDSIQKETIHRPEVDKGTTGKGQHEERAATPGK